VLHSRCKVDAVRGEYAQIKPQVRIEANLGCIGEPDCFDCNAVRVSRNSEMLPDPLQFVHSLHPHEPPTTLQRFHWWIHSKSKLDWPIDVSSQIIFAALVIGAASALR
jgi:hypothetical protein